MRFTAQRHHITPTLLVQIVHVLRKHSAGMGAPHQDFLRSIELFGKDFLPQVRKALGS
ncbi:hypothetical protein [Agrobacterium larrymoorei]|uniref:Uncharacterized protein n=1 Tax=Agrobacterium larrymoorei TaxID=160699 RepID=A0ABX8TEG6_9HYPH|nr:hypothetical protein [Agrobacterium larrymoorei]QYA10431.1 hypothetical protein J5285_22290 [Agrobacterium larrymoorei]